MAKKHQIDMTEGPILKKLFLFAVPIILSGLLQLLYNTADIIVVGKFAGENALGAVGSTSSLIHLMVNLFVGLATGTTVVAANFFGAGNKESVQKTVQTSILLSLFSGLVLTFAGMTGAREILKLMQAPDEVLAHAVVYLKVYFAGITSTMIYNFGSAFLRAKGDTQRPLYILLISGIINVALNLVFVIAFKMGVAGVGAATVISQTFAAAFVIAILLKESDEFKLELKKLSFNSEILIKILKIGIPAGFQGILFSFSNVIIQSSVNTFGPVVIAGNASSQSVENFVYISMNCFAQATLTFASQNFGAQKLNRIKKLTWISLGTVFLIGLVLGSTVIFFSGRIFSLYSSNPDTVKAAVSRLVIICSTYYLCGIMDVSGNIIRGIGHSLLPMLTSLGGACIFRVVWLLTIFRIPEFHKTSTIYLSYPISWIITFTVNIICFVFIFRKLEKKGK